MLHLLFAESALERVPKPLLHHPSVVKRAKALHKEPEEMLLDRTYHHQAMVTRARVLENMEKRGRPDIIHFSLLEALGAPLNREGLLKVHVHTIDDYLISVNSEVRLPRNYDRFIGLVEQLYREGRVPVDDRPLLELRRGNIRNVISEIEPSYVIAFTRRGEPKTVESAIRTLSKQKNPVAIVGGFPCGHFSEETMKLADIAFSLDPEMLEAWTVTSRVIYEFERLTELPEKRWKEKGRDK
jgi:rRNA small subunit pseudouridine methyltransferase Nep1